MEEDKQTFLDHLEEARERIIVSLVTVAIFTVVGLIFADGLFHYVVVKPFDAVNVKPVVLNVTEAIMVRFKVAMLAGLVFSLPVIIFEIWRFVKPGLYAHEIRIVRFLFWCILLLFLLGMAFAYGVVLGMGLPIMKRFADRMGLEAIWSLNSCVSFVLLLLFGFGAAFQLPVIMSALAKMGMVDHQILRNNRSIALVIVLVVSALVTPPDPWTMALMSVPLWLLFELSIMAVRVIGAAEARREETPKIPQGTREEGFRPEDTTSSEGMLVQNDIERVEDTILEEEDWQKGEDGEEEKEEGEGESCGSR